LTGAGGIVAGAGGVVAGGANGSGGYEFSPSGGFFGVGGGAGLGGVTGMGGAAGATGTGGAASPATCGAGSTLTAGETTQTIQVGGTTRSYILHVPSKYDGLTPVPLVLDFHPILANATVERNGSGYATLSDQENFIVAFPEGIDAAWNIGPCCTSSRTVDDVGFAKALVAKLSSQGCIDPKRVYATGFSMGGGMSHMIACNAADIFAAVAPSAFDLLEETEEPCHPARPITEITFRGTADPIVPYAGGASRPPNGLNVTIHFLGAVGTFQKWASLDGCTGSPSAADANGCQTYSQCQAGVEVTLCTTQGGSHTTGNANIGWNTLKRFALP
jgi:polyhydroxybutyrate depolymerase